ncbi:hypothetical protein RND71_015603 [Anisodus tanguticus]|uniref:Uncharacterized protein n=1 Tax=Anisodus tanguticus TaxID=243964 RepID=A0AAE1S657_9SOLA|nr:hypothetical protein RND71_015603 [Anisodus tanguticus]
MEDVAKDFLNELIRRSLIQVADTLWQEVTECRIYLSTSGSCRKKGIRDDESVPATEYLSSCQKLQKLWLDGRIEKLPLSYPFPNSITVMVLVNLELMEDSMPILGMFPNLRNLGLVAAYKGKEITCNDNNFCQLEFLRLDSLQNLERWHLDTSAMPLIKGLGIHDCPKLKEIPELIKDVHVGS